MTHEQEYQVIISQSKQLLCEKCGTPLPLEPESFRRTLDISGTSKPGWFVWHCPNPSCGATNIRRADNVADIEQEIDVICC